MKKNLCILLVFLPLAIFAQNSEVFKIDSLPKQGVLLDKGWKFWPDDNPDYAKPDFDDSKWQSINPALDIENLPQIRQRIVWFRLHLFLDSNLLKEQLALIIEQSGASEIYLNGSLIHRFGVFHTDAAKVRAYDPLGDAIPFSAKNAGRQILSVRYILQSGLRYTTIFGIQNFAVKASINTIPAANRNYQQLIYFLRAPAFSQAGIFFILFILHLSFFLFYRSQKANLYFSLFALFTMLGILGSFFCFNLHWVEQKFYFFNVAAGLIFIGYLFMITALYYQLEQKRGVWYFILMLLGALTLVVTALPGYWGWNLIAQPFTTLVSLEITRISFIAVKRNKRGAWIMAGGSIVYLVSWAAFIGLGHPGQIDLFTAMVFNIAFCSIPVAASIYLGVDFAFTNRLLRQKLVEIEHLSQKAIAQEREKQQILSSVNETLEKQVVERTSELKRSLEELKSTQSQLIQSEKMASLGELTAGIAHEIQNPLNFVNNFSEVNKEMLVELKAERLKPKAERDEENEDDIIDDVIANEEKINHHGKRADAIVKGMLQHSRTSTGAKEPTDINALCDEYLRLSYHGLRAKDKSFNASMIPIAIGTDFDNSIGKINIIPQDIGRVLLNLFNNAFYAVNEKKNASTSSTGQPYEPTVTVITKAARHPSGGVGVLITVSDNGNGISQKIVDKIFQPFFTTKPTGQGTGLGLSLSYDIIKAQGGQIKVETKEGEGTTFIIQLPI